MHNDVHTTDKIVNVIERWTIFFLVLLPYLYLSFRLIEEALYPDRSPRECGTPADSLVLTHTFLAALASLILGLKLYLGKSYGITIQLIVIALILVPLIISVVVYIHHFYQ